MGRRQSILVRARNNRKNRFHLRKCGQKQDGGSPLEKFGARGSGRGVCDSGLCPVCDGRRAIYGGPLSFANLQIETSVGSVESEQE